VLNQHTSDGHSSSYKRIFRWRNSCLDVVVKIELQEELMQDMLQIMNVFVAKMFSYINKP
jgi:predicted site-specific integrase-resolvase